MFRMTVEIVLASKAARQKAKNMCLSQLKIVSEGHVFFVARCWNSIKKYYLKLYFIPLENWSNVSHGSLSGTECCRRKYSHEKNLR